VLDADSFPSAAAVSPEPFGKYCPQSKLEPILLAESQRLGCDARYGVEPTTSSPPTAPVPDAMRHREQLLRATLS
jgi:putative polyketide hydroxylase